MTQDQLNEIWRLHKLGQPVDENVRAFTIGGDPVIDVLLPNLNGGNARPGARNGNWRHSDPSPTSVAAICPISIDSWGEGRLMKGPLAAARYRI